MKLFDIDGPVMRGLSLVSDLVMLNLITLLFCLPVITAGASLTSLHAMVMKFHIGENGHIFKTFWKEFKGNLKKSTVIWIFVLVILSCALAGAASCFASEAVPPCPGIFLFGKVPPFFFDLDTAAIGTPMNSQMNTMIIKPPNPSTGFTPPFRECCGKYPFLPGFRCHSGH